jgi:hypothetical protein
MPSDDDAFPYPEKGTRRGAGFFREPLPSVIHEW